MSFFANIKDRRLPVLEQTCERYALMVYEVFREEFACGFKSIQYSYEDRGVHGHGTFTATLIPFEDDPRHKATKVVFNIASEYDEGEVDADVPQWVLSDARVTDLQDGLGDCPVSFREDGKLIFIKVPYQYGVYQYWVGNSPTHERLFDSEMCMDEFKGKLVF